MKPTTFQLDVTLHPPKEENPDIEPPTPPTAKGLAESVKAHLVETLIGYGEDQIGVEATITSR